MVMREHNDGAMVVPFPDVDSLQREIKRLRKTYIQLVLIHDELKFVECKNIEVNYLFLLGELEYQVVQEQYSYLRIKRKVDLIQDKFKRQEPLQLDQIEKRLDYEFKKYQKTLNEQLEELHQALEIYEAGPLSEEDRKALRRYYFLIIEKICPELYPNLSDKQIEIFTHAVSAYRCWDLQTLKLISEMLGDGVENQVDQMSSKKLMAECVRLKNCFDTTQEDIDIIESKYPYKEKDLIKDAIQIVARKEKLEAMAQQFQEAYRVHKSMLAKLIK